MKQRLIIASSSIVVLIIMLVSTDPQRVPSWVLVLPFLLLFIALINIALALFEKYGLPRSKSFKLAVLCSGIPLALLVLQSIGQLTIRDVLIFGVLFVFAYFYMVKSEPSS